MQKYFEIDGVGFYMDELLDSSFFQNLPCGLQDALKQRINVMRYGTNSRLAGYQIRVPAKYRVLAADPLGHYDSERCNNGGGYWQFHGQAIVKGFRVYVEDSSCGDFGKRIYFGVETKKGKVHVNLDEVSGNTSDWEGLDYLRRRAPHLTIEDLMDVRAGINHWAWQQWSENQD